MTYSISFLNKSSLWHGNRSANKIFWLWPFANLDLFLFHNLWSLSKLFMARKMILFRFQEIAVRWVATLNSISTQAMLFFGNRQEHFKTCLLAGKNPRKGGTYFLFFYIVLQWQNEKIYKLWFEVFKIRSQSFPFKNCCKFQVLDTIFYRMYKPSQNLHFDHLTSLLVVIIVTQLIFLIWFQKLKLPHVSSILC